MDRERVHPDPATHPVQGGNQAGCPSRIEGFYFAVGLLIVALGLLTLMVGP